MTLLSSFSITSKIQTEIVKPDFTNPTNAVQPSRFVFISSCRADWGGSEELWWATAKCLKKQGHAVHVFKTNVLKTHPRFAELENAGVELLDINCLSNPLNISKKRIYIKKLVSYINRFLSVKIALLYQDCPDISRDNHNQVIEKLLIQELLKLQPSLIIISQGDNYDGLHFASIARHINLPYVILSQKAHDNFWHADEERCYMRETFRYAKRCFFVSRHNLSLTEAQIGQKLQNAEVVRNPYLTKVSSPLAWTAPLNDCFKLACVARLYFFDKGQDMLLNVLAQKKWQSRNLHVAFFGEGANREALIDLAKILDVNNVSFPGFVDNVVDIWSDYHGLIMPSRAEGLPLTLVEAMMCGRPGVVTNVGGMPEVIEDNITGFIAKGACVDAIDEALERAWERRHEWEQMGQLAGASIRKLVPSDPASVFSHKLVQLCQTLTKSQDDFNTISISS